MGCAVFVTTPPGVKVVGALLNSPGSVFGALFDAGLHGTPCYCCGVLYCRCAAATQHRAGLRLSVAQVAAARCTHTMGLLQVCERSGLFVGVLCAANSVGLNLLLRL